MIGLYTTDIKNARKDSKGADSKWTYAVVVGALSAVTALVYVIPKVKSHWAFGWDVCLLQVHPLLVLVYDEGFVGLIA